MEAKTKFPIIILLHWFVLLEMFHLSSREKGWRPIKTKEHIVWQSGITSDNSKRDVRGKMQSIFLPIFYLVVIIFISGHLLQKLITPIYKNRFGGTSLSKEVSNRQPVDSLTNIILPASIIFTSDQSCLTDQEACSIESALRKLPDKKVYLLKILGSHGNKSDQGIDKVDEYASELENLYGNFEIVKVMEQTMFENKYKRKYNRRQDCFAAGIMVLWKCGGTYISTNVLMGKRDILDDCTTSLCVSPDFIISKQIGNKNMLLVINYLNQANLQPFDQAAEKSLLVNTLGNAPNTQFIDNKYFCDELDESECNFVITEKLKKTNNWIAKIPEFCRQIVKYYASKLQNEEEVRNEVKQIMKRLQNNLNHDQKPELLSGYVKEVYQNL